VALYSYASGSPARAAEFRWSAADGVTLTVFDREWGALAERYMAEGIGSDALRRPVLPREGATFMRTLVQPTRSTYLQFVDESDPGPASPGPTGAPLPARTSDEARLYLDLHPCEGCGRVNLPWQSGPVFVNGVVARAYAGTCPGCGRERRFVFEHPESTGASASSPAEPVSFGGPQPSRLVDAGVWLAVADLTASRMPADDPAGARYALSVAVAAVNEVLKFIPPGAERVPAEAFWSERGRQVWTADPGRFEAERLRVVRDVYTERLAALAGDAADSPQHRPTGG
jgi:hypothetical protein